MAPKLQATKQAVAQQQAQAQAQAQQEAAAAAVAQQQSSQLSTRLSAANEQVWLRIGAISDLMDDHDKALHAYECALRHNAYNVQTLTAAAAIFKKRDNWPKASEYLQRAVKIDSSNGETWAQLAYTYLLSDDVQNAYTAYQHALYHLPNPKASQVWYGIGMLYERCGSLEHAEEAFTGVLKMDPNSDKKTDILFRLGTIYKQTQKYPQALECFLHIVHTPPHPRTAADVWLQVGHVYELQSLFDQAMQAYNQGIEDNPNHPKLLQHLAWLRLLDSPLQNVQAAIQLLLKAAELEANDAQTWYILGRCQVGTREYNRAHFAYQQAVYRDERNPTLWCSIGILYYKIGQYKEALDAYSKAIRFNPYMSAVWYNLGTLYESCKQPPDAKDAYQHALELDSDNAYIRERLTRLQLALENPSMKLDDLPQLPPVMEPVAIKALESAGYNLPAPLPALLPSGSKAACAMETRGVASAGPSPSPSLLLTSSAGGASVGAGVGGRAATTTSASPAAIDLSRFHGHVGSAQLPAEHAEIARKMASDGGLMSGGLLALSKGGGSLTGFISGGGASLLGLVPSLAAGAVDKEDKDDMEKKDKDKDKDKEDKKKSDKKDKEGKKKKDGGEKGEGKAEKKSRTDNKDKHKDKDNAEPGKKGVEVESGESGESRDKTDARDARSSDKKTDKPSSQDKKDKGAWECGTVDKSDNTSAAHKKDKGAGAALHPLNPEGEKRKEKKEKRMGGGSLEGLLDSGGESSLSGVCGESSGRSGMDAGAHGDGTTDKSHTQGERSESEGEKRKEENKANGREEEESVGVGIKKGRESGNVSRDRDKDKHLTPDKHPKEPSSTSHTGGGRGDKNKAEADKQVEGGGGDEEGQDSVEEGVGGEEKDEGEEHGKRKRLADADHTHTDPHQNMSWNGLKKEGDAQNEDTLGCESVGSSVAKDQEQKGEKEKDKKRKAPDLPSHPSDPTHAPSQPSPHPTEAKRGKADVSGKGEDKESKEDVKEELARNAHSRGAEMKDVETEAKALQDKVKPHEHMSIHMQEEDKGGRRGEGEVRE